MQALKAILRPIPEIRKTQKNQENVKGNGAGFKLSGSEMKPPSSLPILDCQLV